MANILGFDGPAIVLFLVLGTWGITGVTTLVYDAWYVLVGILGLMLLTALVIVISNPKEYLTVPDFY